ncbi:type II toxin-antitoxin system PemK/MazF family toxin [Sphingomonas sp.]|jgi:uncharacterized protein YifN (PemK superfamily)|uniref:type II toxin-antitoxin system PemK/MazF family toxin n=1 Tax=Sphingomonas sp. TaxID=28214 RepID=UPI0039C8D8A2
MALSYYPSTGEILVCHYGQAAFEPEMNKSRPVVVIGPRLRRRGRLVTVVPLSTTAPTSTEPYHCLIQLDQSLPAPFSERTIGPSATWCRRCRWIGSIVSNRSGAGVAVSSGGARVASLPRSSPT